MRFDDIISSILIIFIFLLLYSVNVFVSKYQYIKDNWAEYRCKPEIMPVSSLWGVDTQENFMYCTETMQLSMMDPILAPINSTLGGILGIAGSLTSNLTSLSDILGNLSLDNFNFVTMITEFFSSFTKMFEFLVLILMDIIQRIVASVVSVLYLLTSGNNAIQSLYASQKPLIESVQGFTGTKPSCFHPDTIVPLINNNYKKIKDITLSDTLLNNINVEGIMKLKYQDNEENKFYKLFNKDGTHILVTAKHLVYYNKKWINVEDHPNALITDVKTDIVYCLITNTHTIPIKDYIFHDWEDNDGIPNKSVKV